MRNNYFLMIIAAIILAISWPQRIMAEGVSQTQFDAAYQAITNAENQDAEGKLWYRIYTYCTNGTTGEMSTTRHYLTTVGTLTADEEQSGIFQFLQVGEDAIGFSSIYSKEIEKAFFIKNGTNYFTNANKATGNSIHTAANGRPTYEAQVFFMNEKGLFAIRSTNAMASTWWESAWWTVNDEGSACYTEPDASDDDITHANFIWEIELAEANDFVIIDESKHYNLSFSQIRSGSSHKYILSPSYYQEMGYTDELIHRTIDSRMKQMEIEITATGAKNTYYMRDVTSGYYIKPASNNNNGSEWSISGTPCPIVVELTGTTDTYTIAGEAGGKANPLGNDAAPYKVGNWNGSNNILFTAIDNSNNPAYYNNIAPAFNALTAADNADENGEYWYHISTYSEDGKTFGSTKYYLTPSSTLSDKAAEAGTFQFINVGEAADGLSTMAFRVKSGSNYFTNPNKTTGTSLRTSFRGSDTYEAQVFCLKDGKYAVRSTNADAGDWWEQSWWTIASPGISCYTLPSDDAAAYIWDIEKAEAIDDRVRFDEKAYYTITLNKNITYKYIQSPAYNTADDNVLRRSTDASHIFYAKIATVKGVKNGFTIQDKESGKYIVPATNKNNGTSWTVAETPATVIFNETAPGLYTMASIQGAFANAYNDDNEQYGYTVANYTSGSAWIFTAQAEGDSKFDEDILNQMTDASITIGEEGYYKVYTTSLDGGKTFGTTKYYVTDAGELTTDANSAGVFNFIAVGETTEGYCNYAYYMKNGANYFTNTNNRVEGTSIRTSTNKRPTYEAQVFFMNEDERFAIRSTNAAIGSYWEDAWWNARLDEKDVPIACYTQPGMDNAKYIWHLEEAEENDFITFDANASYTMSANKSNLAHKFIQSPKHNEPGDITIRRTDDGDKAISLSITPVDGKKNFFQFRDSETGLCITPSESTENGASWTFCEDGQVYLEKVHDNVYLISGENGSIANAYGDDNETEGYKVAHYGAASQWIVTIAGSDDDPVQIVDIKKDIDSSTVYSIQGFKQKPIFRGLYITGGRKVMTDIQ